MDELYNTINIEIIVAAQEKENHPTFQAWQNFWAGRLDALLDVKYELDKLRNH